MGCDFYLMTYTRIKFINCDYYDVYNTDITERIYCINENHFKKLSNDNRVNIEILYTKKNKWCIDTQNVEKLYSFISEIKAFLKKYHEDKKYIQNHITKNVCNLKNKSYFKLNNERRHRQQK